MTLRRGFALVITKEEIAEALHGTGKYAENKDSARRIEVATV
jgi:hypothetical protein